MHLHNLEASLRLRCYQECDNRNSVSGEQISHIIKIGFQFVVVHTIGTPVKNPKILQFYIFKK